MKTLLFSVDFLEFIDLYSYLENLTVVQKNAMASVLYSQKFAKGQPIVVEGDPGSSYYIIKEVIDLLPPFYI